MMGVAMRPVKLRGFFCILVLGAAIATANCVDAAVGRVIGNVTDGRSGLRDVDVLVMDCILTGLFPPSERLPIYISRVSKGVG